MDLSIIYLHDQNSANIVNFQYGNRLLSFTQLDPLKNFA
jgi:hypothetical protein